MVTQCCTISDWHPQTNPNGPQSNRYVQHRKRRDDAIMAWATAKQAGWKFMHGKVRLRITLVYRKRPLPDPDNLRARCKGIIDGLRLHPSPWIKPRPDHPELNAQLGFFTNDNDDWLALDVQAVVEKGVKCVRLELEQA